MNENSSKRIALIACLVIAVVSIILGLTVFSQADFYTGIVSSLDEKQGQVLGLLGATSAAAVGTAVLPGGSGLSTLFANLGSGFLVVYASILLEKYLFVAITKIVFVAVIPISCVLYAASQFVVGDGLRIIAKKIVAFGIALFLAVPVSLMISDAIVDVYGTTMGIEATAAQTESQTQEATEDTSSEQATAENEQATQDEGNALTNFINNAQSALNNALSDLQEKAENAATSTLEEIQTNLNNMFEYLAVLLVTTCVIPLLVMLFFIWLVKIIFNVNIDVSAGKKLFNGKLFGAIPVGKKEKKPELAAETPDQQNEE